MSESTYYDTLQQSIQQHAESANLWRSESARHEQSRNDMIAQVNGFINGFASRQAVPLEVGVGKPFATIIDAYNTIRNKVLTAPVLIKVADGIHDSTGIDLGYHPFAHLIRIQGNAANPANCVIRWMPDAQGNSHGFIMRGMIGLNISGFRFVGSDTEANFTHRSIWIGHNSYVYSDDNSIIIDGGSAGIEVHRSQYHCKGLRSSNLAGPAVIASQSSAIIITHAVIAGRGIANTPAPARFNTRLVSRGIWMMDNSHGYCSDNNISNVATGIYAERGSSVEFSRSTATASKYGFLVSFGANAQSFEGAVAKNCEHGFIADQGSQLMINGVKAEGCTTVGFLAAVASNIYGNNTVAVNNNVGYQSLYGSVLNVPNSNALASGNTVLRDVDADSKLLWS